MGTEVQRGYIPATKDLSQVSSLLVWTDRFLAIFLFYASEVNSPLATHCTKREAPNPCCTIESSRELSENVMPGPQRHKSWFSWPEVGPLAQVFLENCPGDISRHAELRTRPKAIRVLVRNPRRWTQGASIEWQVTAAEMPLCGLTLAFLPTWKNPCWPGHRPPTWSAGWKWPEQTLPPRGCQERLIGATLEGGSFGVSHPHPHICH